MKERPGRGLAARAWLAPAAILAMSLACESDVTRPRDNVPIQNDFGSKIVYGTSQRLDVNALRAHCQDVGGTFNECGRVCAPTASTCVTVCAFTCENIPR